MSSLNRTLAPRSIAVVGGAPAARVVEQCKKLGFKLPEPGHYAVGHVFLPRDAAGRKLCEEIIERVTKEEGQTFLGWRDVPVNTACLGESVKPTEPTHRQISPYGYQSR